MAISVVNRDSLYDNVDRTSYTTASVSIAAGSVVLVAVHCCIASGTAPTITVSGLTLTWTQVADQLYSGTVRRVAVWRAFAASAQTGTITIAHDVTSTGTGWSVNEVTGMDTTTPVLQPTAATGNSGTASVTLAAASDSNNRPFLWQAHRTNSASTPEASWTELSDNAGGSPNMGGSAGWRSDTFDTTCTATFTTGEWGAIALEIAIAAGAVQPVIPFRMAQGVDAGTILLAHIRARPEFRPVIVAPAPEAAANSVIPIFVGRFTPTPPTIGPRAGYYQVPPFQEAAAAATPVIPIFVATLSPRLFADIPQMGFRQVLSFQAAQNIPFSVAAIPPPLLADIPQMGFRPLVPFQEAPATANAVIEMLRAQLLGQAVPPLLPAPFFFPFVPFIEEAPANIVIPILTPRISLAAEVMIAPQFIAFPFGAFAPPPAPAAAARRIVITPGSQISMA